MAVFEDEFSTLVNANLQDHTPDIGTAWTLVSGGINNLFVHPDNLLKCNNGAVSLLTSDELSNPDCYVEITMPNPLPDSTDIQDCFWAIRIQDASNFIGMRVFGNGSLGMRLTKVVAGVRTDLSQSQPVGGSRYRVGAEGTTIKVYEDDIQIGSNHTITEFATETAQGIISGNALSNFLDSYRADVVGGSGISIAVDSGSYSYIGTDAQLIVSRILKVDAGSYLYTGSPVSLLKGFVLTASSGSYSYLGQDATLTYTPAGAFILTANSGNYTYTGSNINFNRDRVIIASSGTYNYNGTDIQIILPGQIWADKPSVSTNWNNQTVTTTIWTDK